MKTPNSDFPRYTFDAVVTFPGLAGDEPQAIHIHTGDETYSGWTWLDPLPYNEHRVDIVTITMVPTGPVDDPVYVITDLNPCRDRDVFDLIPDHFGCHESTVFRCRDVVDAIQAPSLRHFMSHVFSIPEVFHWFWTCPASQKHHHNLPGGLALHSLEMAESIIANPHLEMVERDFAIVYAVLHDIGKIWCYRNDGTYGGPLGHEILAIDHLHGPLRRLEWEWLDGATAIRSLLSGLWKGRGHKPIMAVGKLVQGLDQVSTEQNLRTSETCGPTFKPWTPRLPAEQPF